MKKSEFSEVQIVAILQEGAAGRPIVELLRKHGISRLTFYLWRLKYGGAGLPKQQQLKGSEQENARLRRMYAEMALDNEPIKGVFSGTLSGSPCDGQSWRLWSGSTSSRCAKPVASPDSHGPVHSRPPLRQLTPMHR